VSDGTEIDWFLYLLEIAYEVYDEVVFVMRYYVQRFAVRSMAVVGDGKIPYLRDIVPHNNTIPAP
jgi:hypothetical protein